MSDQALVKIAMLERALLELGTEVFNLKGGVAKNMDSHAQFLQIIRGLKTLLDEKGVITADDFESAVDLGHAVERFSSQAEHAIHNELEKVKKISH